MKRVTEHYYNVCAYIGKDRVMKETLTAKNRAQALNVGRVVLRSRGFKLSDVSLEVVPLSRRRMDRVFGASATLRDRRHPQDAPPVMRIENNANTWNFVQGLINQIANRDPRTPFALSLFLSLSVPTSRPRLHLRRSPVRTTPRLPLTIFELDAF